MALVWIFGKLNLVSKIEFDLNQFWELNFISSLVKNLAFGNYLNKYILELPGQFGDSRTIGFTNLSKVFGLEN